MLEITSAKLTGTPGLSGWAQVHDFTPGEADKFSTRGRIVAVIATSRVEDGVDTITAGREFISRLHEEYFGDLSVKPFNALEGAVRKVSGEFRQSWGDVEIAAASFVGEVVYSVASGGGEITICREGALGTILKSESTNTVAASGFPKKGDTILLATHEFYNNVSQGVIKAVMSGGSVEVQGNMGAAVIKFEERSLGIMAPESPKIIPVPIKISVPAITGFFAKISKLIPRASIYLRSGQDQEAYSKNKKVTFSVAIILLVILFVSIIFGIRQKRINSLRGKYQGILTSAQGNVDQAISLASVSPDKSRELFIDSEQKLKAIDALKVKDPKVEELRQKIEDSKASILGEYEGKPELFLDLGLLSSGFKGDSLAASSGSIIILDKAGKRVVSVALDSKKSKVVAGPTLIDTAGDLAAYDDSVFILGSDGIYEIGTGKNKVIDASWQGDALIRAFAGNMYVLDKSGNAIYRFSGQGNTFLGQQNWLAAGTKVDFSGAKSWGIDGSVYVLFPNSKIQKFSLGSPQAFSISGVFPEIGSVDALFADPDNQYLYFLDRAGKRVVVTDKKGKYKAQYTGDEIGGAVSLAVSEAGKKLILLTGDKLLSIELKHL